MTVVLAPGTTVLHESQRYDPGTVVELPEDLAQALIRTHSARPVEGSAPPEGGH